MTATANFTAYNDKSSAKRGFGRKFKGSYDVEEYLQQRDGKWGFEIMNDGPLLPTAPKEDNTDHGHPEAGASAEEIAAVADVQPAVKSVFPTSTFGQSASPVPKADVELNAALSQHHEDGSDVEQDVAHDAFSTFANSQLTSRPQPSIEPAKATSNHSRVERNREEANGVKRPSAGTLCAQVWDIATQLSNGDEKPRNKIATLSEVVKTAESKGINKFTARTQYARWRVFHGITGRNV